MVTVREPELTPQGIIEFDRYIRSLSRTEPVPFTPAESQKISEFFARKYARIAREEGIGRI